jgi:hypothetical protein
MKAVVFMMVMFVIVNAFRAIDSDTVASISIPSNEASSKIESASLPLDRLAIHEPKAKQSGSDREVYKSYVYRSCKNQNSFLDGRHTILTLTDPKRVS